MEQLGCYEFRCKILMKAIYFQRYLSTPLVSESKSRCELLHSTYPLHVIFRREMVTWFFFILFFFFFSFLCTYGSQTNSACVACAIVSGHSTEQFNSPKIRNSA